MDTRRGLASIRPIEDTFLFSSQKLLRVLYALLFGAALGVLAKMSDSVSMLGDIGTRVGVWVFVATLLAAYSRSPWAAGVHVLAFFAGMLAAYYLYTILVLHFTPVREILRWSVMGGVAAVGALALWYARGRGPLAALAAAIPIALLVLDGYSFVYTLAVPSGVALVCAVLLLVLLPQNLRQTLWTLVLTALLAVAGWYFHVLSYVGL